MVQVPKALSPEPYKSPIAKPLSAEQRDALQTPGPGPTRSPPMPIPDNTPLRVGTINQPQEFVTARSRRTEMLGMSPAATQQASTLHTRIAAALNSVSAENGSDTPDFILANYLLGCLHAFDYAVTERDRWYGRGGPMAETEPTPTDPSMNQATPFSDETQHSDAESLAKPTGRDRLA